MISGKYVQEVEQELGWNFQESKVCLEEGHDWELLSGSPFEWDGEDPMFLYHCLNCEDTKVDL